MKKPRSGTGVAGERRARRQQAGRKTVRSDIPGILARLVDWRRAEPALTETRPRYRHD